MKILYDSPLKVIPLGDRLYGVAEDFTVRVLMDGEGTMRFTVKAGFITNFRSGGLLVDPLVDQVGDTVKAVIYLVHDMMYTPCDYCYGEHPVSRELADRFLRDALRESGMSDFTSWLVYAAVRTFGESAYSKDDALTPGNRGLFTFTWEAK